MFTAEEMELRLVALMTECHDVGRYLWAGEDSTSDNQRYINDILRPTVLPFLQQKSRGVIY